MTIHSGRFCYRILYNTEDVVICGSELRTSLYVVLEYLECLESSVRESHLHENGGLQDSVQ